jgi:hypothetical protein
MSLLRAVKTIGKLLGVDYFLDLVKSGIRLIGLRIGFGVSISTGKRRIAKSEVPIDIVIPVIDKDADSLPFVIDSARRMLKHPITGIYLVCPAGSSRIREIADDKGCTVVDESGLLPIGKKDIDYRVRGTDRSGWLYQQFLKWCGDAFVAQDHYLILDSDTVLSSPQAFMDGDKLVFDYCDTVHKPYFEAYERLFGHPPACPVSFTSHHTMVERKAMRELKAALESAHGCAWYDAIISTIDREEMSSHSDYDTYGQFFFETRRDDMTIRYWANKSLPRDGIWELERYKKIYGGRYRTLSFHEYRK